MPPQEYVLASADDTGIRELGLLPLLVPQAPHSTRVRVRPHHHHEEVLAQINDGAMDGFVRGYGLNTPATGKVYPRLVDNND